MSKLGVSDITPALVAAAKPLLLGLVVFIIGSASPWFLLLVAAGALVGLLSQIVSDRTGRVLDELDLSSTARVPPLHDGPTMSRISPEGGPGLVFMLVVVYMFLTTLFRDLGGALFVGLASVLAILGAISAVRAVARGRAGQT